MTPLLKNPLFVLGLAFRLTLLALLLPHAAGEWYVPFMQSSVQALSLDPWHAHIAAGGEARAFPYGYVMWLIFLPLSLLCKLIGVSLWWGYGLTLLMADFSLMLVLKRLIRISDGLLLVAYWWSPIVLFASYWLGLNDLVSVLLLSLALLCMRELRPAWAGVMCAVAVSSKLSMALAVPFFFVYIWRKRALRQMLKPYLAGLLTALAVLEIPFILSADAMHALISNPEMEKVYTFSVIFGDNRPMYILPMAYLLTLYMAWRTRRMSFDLFFVLLGIAFSLVLLLTPAAPGWFLWVMPLLVFYQATSGRVAIFLVALCTVLYVVSNVFAEPRPWLLGGEAPDHWVVFASNHLGPHSVGLLYTMFLSVGIILVLSIWREVIKRDNYFRLSRKPLVIGIAGDSGAGKDTLVDALTGLFGGHSVIKLSGDDYHFWDRHKPMWQVMTHLNPRANDLEQMAHNLISLVDGKSIVASHYNHATGKMSKPLRIASNDFIFVSGLHALYLPILRDCYDLSIYLDIDEDLRRYFKLQRDVHQRGHSMERVLSSFDKREADSHRFVRPQVVHADLVISLHPISPRILEDVGDGKHPLRFKLLVRARHSMHEESLMRALVGLCGLHVDMTFSGNDSQVELIIEGETSAEDVALSAQLLVPELSELLDVQPKWEDGIVGLMQLIVLSHVNQTLRNRLI